MKSKLIAFYLPQFHEIEENNLWWWKGFTEWTNVKKATSLFEKHKQPRIPLYQNYYNLLDENVQIWQSKIAKEYWIDGFCYYHYWFNGEKLLEQPAENMLINNKIDIPFCFSWANHDWTRRWETWGTAKILKKQIYWWHNDWENHFNYLINFFKDPRYIKQDNKPVFLIYNAKDIPNFSDLLSYWDKRVKENWFPWIYILETANSFQKNIVSSYSSWIVWFEPLYTFQHNLSFLHKVQLVINLFFKKFFKKPLFIIRHKYDDIWKNILQRKYENLVPHFLCAFVDWDNSPRKWKNAYIAIWCTPKKFWFYFEKLIEKSKKEWSENFIFINAWNEWGEWAYLEPDLENTYEYLNEIKKIKSKL